MGAQIKDLASAIIAAAESRKPLYPSILDTRHLKVLRDTLDPRIYALKRDKTQIWKMMLKYLTIKQCLNLSPN